LTYKFLLEKGGNVLLKIHVVPNARTTEIIGQHGDALKIRISAPPVDGAANEEVCRYFSKLLKVKKSAVAVVSGQTSKQKTVAVAGVTIESVQAALVF